MARILVAEDDDAVRGFVQRALVEDGHDGIVARDGAEALDVLHREAGATEVMVASVNRYALMHELRGADEPPPNIWPKSLGCALGCGWA